MLVDGVSPFEFAVICEVFGFDRPEVIDPWPYDLTLCSPGGKAVRTSMGFAIDGVQPLSAADNADTIVVPACHADGDNPPPPDVIALLQRAHARGARLLSVCSGAFALAHAGLLDGRRATTHWMHTERLAAAFPAIDVDPNVLYVDDGQILTSAGTAAGIDLCLHVLRTDHGAAVANAVARQMVVAPHRDGGQAQFVRQSMPMEAESDGLAATLDWAVVHLDQPLTVELLAARGDDEPAYVRAAVPRRDGHHTVAVVVAPTHPARATAARNDRPSDRSRCRAMRLRFRDGSAHALPTTRQHVAARLPTHLPRAGVVKFSELTAVTRTTTDAFDVNIEPSSFIVRGPNGGYLAAVLLRAMTMRVGDLGDDPVRPVRSLTVHYARAPVAGPATITTELVRVGRSLVTCSARLEQDGRPALAALGAFSPAWSAVEWQHDPPPPVPPPDAVGLPVRDRAPLPFTDYWDPRFALGSAPGEKADRAETGGWMRLAEPEPVDAMVIAAMTDAWFPAVFALVDTPVPTVDLTIHFRVAFPYAALGPDDFALVRFVSRSAADGFVEEDGQLWAPDGTLVAHSRQLAILLPG